MDLLKPIRSVVNKVKNAVSDMQEQQNTDKKLQKWKKKLESSRTNVDLTIMDQREAIYLGTREVDANVNSTQKPVKKANNIYNIAFEMIETPVNTQIPQPSVKSKREGFDDQARMIEDSITNDLKEINIEEINDVNERLTPIHGFSIVTIDWDPDYKHHLYRGEYKISSKHPKQLITQPKVWDIQKMDYFFILSSVTKDYINRRYGVELEDNEEEQYPEINSLISANTYQGGAVNTDNEPVTEIVCWYRDDDGDICKFVWVNDTVCEDLPKYFYRRIEQCLDCGEPVQSGEGACPNCGSKNIDQQILEDETLTEAVQIGDGSVLQPGEKVPYFVPTRYPISIRINVPKSFTFGGQSDVDVIRDQQDSIKKVGTKIEDKQLKGGSILLMPDDLNVQVTNETYQVIKANAAQAAAIQVRELKAPINDDLNYIEAQRTVVQRMLGITNAFQGMEDQTAKSGIAKQIQVQQASGRQNSKMFNKYRHFKEIFEIVFEHKLAFYDELRPYLYSDANGKDQFGEFNKYAFLVRDSTGQLFYNTDFLFSADAGSGLPKDPMFVYQQAQDHFKSGAIDQMQLWTILDALNFPQAKQIKSQLEERMQQAQMGQAQGIISVLAQLAPQERDAFFSAPPDQQAAMMEQILGQQAQQGTPQQGAPQQPPQAMPGGMPNAG